MVDNELGNDEYLIKEIRKGNENAFDVLYNKYERMIFKHLSLFFSQDEIEDIAQEIFIAIYNQIPKFDPSIAKFKTLVFTIVTNNTFYHLRKKGLLNKTFVSEDEYVNLIDGKDFSVDLEIRELYQMVMKRMSLRDKSVINLRLQGFKLNEIAELLNTTHDAVKASSSRALKIFRKYLGLNDSEKGK